MKKKILILAGFYLPSVKGGGPIQSIRNLVDNFGSIFDFYILAADRDLGDEKPFNSVDIDRWNKTEGTMIYYTNMKLLSWKKLKSIIESLNCDVLYLNSFFAFKDSIVPIILHKFNLSNNIKFIIAPRGQFSKGALGLNSWKKKIYVEIAKLLGLYKNIEWHATTTFEREDIERVIGGNINVHIANNLTPNYNNLKLEKFLHKQSGKLKLVYIARIHPMKNLLQTLEILNKIEGDIEFNIYGPIEDKPYWNKCQDVIKNMTVNIKVNYLGPILNEKVNSVYKKQHTAILMTLGENFGHSIAEALIGGCPVIISDRTPWNKLEEYNAGYDISLENEEKFISAIEHYIRMNNQEYQVVSKSAFDYAKTNSNTEDNIISYLQMFDFHK